MQVFAVIAHIESWLKEYSQNSRTKGFVVGVSGGIDSAVAASLCARTGLPTLLLDLPIHQAEVQLWRSQQHIKELEAAHPNVRSLQISLTDTFDTMIAALPDPDESTDVELSLANVRSRLRMTTLYYFAGMEQKLVVGTGNKVEDFGIGFFTKYGDGGVDISPLADLNKTEIYTLGHALKINQTILNAAPTDGLWGDDRTDEEQIGASYPELEWAMDFKGDRSSLSNRQLNVLEIYERMHRANQHKVQPIPICEIPPELRQKD